MFNENVMIEFIELNLQYIAHIIKLQEQQFSCNYIIACV